MWTYLSTNSGALTSSQELVELARPWCRGLKQLPIVKTTNSLKRSYSVGWNEVKLTRPQSGTMLQPLAKKSSTKQASKKLTLSQEAGPVRETQLRVKDLEWKTSGVDLLGRSQGLLANYDQNSSSWKMLQVSSRLRGMASAISLTKWPQWGMTVDGECHQLKKPLIADKDYFCWPTPQANDGTKFYTLSRPAAQKRITDGRQLHWLHHAILSMSLPFGRVNPLFSEWLIYGGIPTHRSALSATAIKWHPPKRRRLSKG